MKATYYLHLEGWHAHTPGRSIIHIINDATSNKKITIKNLLIDPGMSATAAGVSYPCRYDWYLIDSFSQYTPILLNGLDTNAPELTNIYCGYGGIVNTTSLFRRNIEALGSGNYSARYRWGQSVTACNQSEQCSACIFFPNSNAGHGAQVLTLNQNEGIAMIVYDPINYGHRPCGGVEAMITVGSYSYSTYCKNIPIFGQNTVAFALFNSGVDPVYIHHLNKTQENVIYGSTIQGAYVNACYDVVLLDSTSRRGNIEYTPTKLDSGDPDLPETIIIGGDSHPVLYGASAAGYSLGGQGLSESATGHIPVHVDHSYGSIIASTLGGSKNVAFGHLFSSAIVQNRSTISNLDIYPGVGVAVTNKHLSITVAGADGLRMRTNPSADATIDVEFSVEDYFPIGSTQGWVH